MATPLQGVADACCDTRLSGLTALIACAGSLGGFSVRPQVADPRFAVRAACGRGRHGGVGAARVVPAVEPGHSLRGRIGPRTPRSGGEGDDSTTWGVFDKKLDLVREASHLVRAGGRGVPTVDGAMPGQGAPHSPRGSGRHHIDGGWPGNRSADGRRPVRGELRMHVGPDHAPAWRLALTADDPSGFGGVLADDRGVPIARIRATDRQTGEPVHLQRGRPRRLRHGNKQWRRRGGGAGVPGQGDPGPRRAAARRCALATVAAALLLWTPLR